LAREGNFKKEKKRGAKKGAGRGQRLASSLGEGDAILNARKRHGGGRKGGAGAGVTRKLKRRKGGRMQAGMRVRRLEKKRDALEAWGR